MHLAIGAVSLPSGSSSPTPDKIEAAAKLDPRVSESLSQGISDLAEMAPCHHFAEQALNILRYLAKKWNIDVNIADQGTPEDSDRHAKPYTSSLNFFAPNVRSEDFICDWGLGFSMQSSSEGRAAQKAGDSMENPLFWPFPMQGRPMLPGGTELEQAGFAML